MESSRSWGPQHQDHPGLGRSSGLGRRLGLGLVGVLVVWVYGGYPWSHPFTTPDRRREGYDRPLGSYRCPDCGRWNTTSQREGVGW
jgi:hypothetical protein